MNQLLRFQEMLKTLPEDTTSILLNKAQGGKPQSKNVSKMIVILGNLSDQEKKEFYIFAQEILDDICANLLNSSVAKETEKGEDSEAQE